MDKLLPKTCNKVIKRKLLRHSLSIFNVNLRVSLILLTKNQNQPNVLLIMKSTPFCGVFYLLLQKMVEHVKN